MIRVEFATAEDLAANYGAPIGRTVRAVVFKRDAEVVGCAGLYLDAGRMVMFSDVKDEVRQAPRAVVKAYRTLLGIAERTGLAVHAIPDPGIDKAVPFLERMGFAYLDRGVYQWQP